MWPYSVDQYAPPYRQEANAKRLKILGQRSSSKRCRWLCQPVVLNVNFLLIENVPALVERDDQHRLVTRLVEVADKADFVLA